MKVFDLRLKAGAETPFKVPDGWNTLLVVLHGEIDAEGQKIGADQVADFSREEGQHSAA